MAIKLAFLLDNTVPFPPNKFGSPAGFTRRSEVTELNPLPTTVPPAFVGAPSWPENLETKELNITTAASVPTGITLNPSRHIILVADTNNIGNVGIDGLPGTIFVNSFQIEPGALVALDYNIAAGEIYITTGIDNNKVYVYATS